jgi:dolichol kinase
MLLLACIPIFLLILVTEYLWRNKKIHVETSRKLIHMGTGIIVAFMPFFITYDMIKLLSIAFLAVIFISYKLHILQSIHAVKRVTIGELLYPIGIGICAFLEPAVWIFTAAILHLAIADSVASIAGIKWGKRTRYMVVTHGKSLVGSFAFFVASVLILASTIPFVAPASLPQLSLLLGFAPLVLVLTENLSLLGTDDLTIPVAVIVLLSGLPS